MKPTPKTILYTPLIGFEVEVLKRKNPDLPNFRGVVVDETYNLLYLKTSEGVKKIVKKDVTLLIKLPGGVKVSVDGAKLIGRPEDRVKRMRIRRW